MHVRAHHLRRGARERQAPCQQFERHHTQGVLIGRRRNRIGRTLFRAHVRPRADDEPRVCGARPVVATRDAEVGHDRAPVAVNEHVRRFHVAVDHATVVRVLQPFGRLGNQHPGDVNGQHRLVLQHRVEAAPFDELHHDGMHVVERSHGIDRDDVRMLQRCNGPCLTEEAIGH